jgi:hypothetical protein
MAEDQKPGKVETTQEKTERLRALRQAAESAKNARVERATRKAVARRKVLGDPKG